MALQVLYVDGAPGKAYVLDRQSQSLTNAAAQSKKKPDEQPVTEARSCFLHQCYLFCFKISLHKF
jgi:hypothetical protein